MSMEECDSIKSLLILFFITVAQLPMARSKSSENVVTKATSK
jgi:hypothetical protein